MSASAQRKTDYARASEHPATTATRQAVGSAEGRTRQPRDESRLRRWLPTLATCLLVPLFISAGLWQWNKAAAKAERAEQLATRNAQAAIRLGASPVEPERLRFRKVTAAGRYDAAHQILIDNRTLNGQAGFHVVTPLRVEGSEVRVLINRGWIPANAQHRLVPGVETPTGEVEVSGTAVVPSPRFISLGSATTTTGRAGDAPAVWQNLDLAALADTLPYALQPIVVELDASSKAGGFIRQWAVADDRRLTNLGYAFQWWGFALVTCALWVFFTFQRWKRGPR